mmetsp:Transcript_46744/g.122755  ORF Transcript_46744/g.122755 Transcript_46744/m.122755 type:complete len:107 (-) Transcript_46744:74-394(-)
MRVEYARFVAPMPPEAVGAHAAALEAIPNPARRHEWKEVLRDISLDGCRCHTTECIVENPIASRLKSRTHVLPIHVALPGHTVRARSTAWVGGRICASKDSRVIDG